MASSNDIEHRIRRVGAGSSAESAVVGVSRKGASTLGHWFGGVTVATGALAVISQWEHVSELHRLKSEYDHEIGRLTGKRSKDVTTADLEKAAKVNPIIHDAVDRSAKKRNLSVGVTVAGGLAAAGIGAALAGSTLPVLVVGAIGFAGFMAVEHVLTKVGEKAFRINEPDLADVEKGKARQGELSAASQITLLAKEQGKNKAITQDKVMTVFATANRGLADKIRAMYGTDYASLDDRRKTQVLEKFGPEYGVAQWTDDLNSHKVRAQELTFASVGQASSRDEAAQSSQRMGFANAKVSAAIPGSNTLSQEETMWRKRIRAQQAQRQASMAMG